MKLSEARTSKRSSVFFFLSWELFLSKILSSAVLITKIKIPLEDVTCDYQSTLMRHADNNSIIISI
jgi:hypothetical protein